MLNNLIKLKEEKKFFKNDKMFYPGAKTEQDRILLESIINNLLDKFINDVKDKPIKSYVLNELKNTLSKCNEFDTEDREMICNYLEKIMDIFEINSSDGLLNEWMYGFNPK
jgi:hypothetical protein